MPGPEPQPPPAAWCGWHRPSRREPWRQLAEGATYDAAWGLLLDRLPRGAGGESTVLPAGASPADPPPGAVGYRRQPGRSFRPVRLGG